MKIAGTILLCLAGVEDLVLQMWYEKDWSLTVLSWEVVIYVVYIQGKVRRRFGRLLRTMLIADL